MSGTGLRNLASAREVLVTAGSGGVGKTTTAAAIAAMAASTLGLKVLVVTVDPAKRLANAMGLEQFGNVEVRVDDAAFEAAGIRPTGELWAAMLDTKESWDDLVRRHAPDAATRDAILANPLYGNISARFVQSHDYVAMERLYELHSSGRFDLIVVDTPPTRNALDFLDAPERMAEFFSSRLLRWLIAPSRSRVITMASKPFYTVADRILGSQFLSDIAEFFMLFQSMYDGFVERSQSVSRLLASDVTSFVVVSTLEAAAAREARFFLSELQARDYDVGALVLNKTLPRTLTDEAATVAAHDLVDHGPERARVLAEALETDDEALAHLERMLPELGENFLRFQLVAGREAEERDRLTAGAGVVASVPYFADDIGDLAGLVRLGRRLWDEHSG
ncbi:MAG: AAA family ATPase [Microthrixaceae bacterium]|nr:AAA family ATPase [Microthrixaceae bacterium]